MRRQSFPRFPFSEPYATQRGVMGAVYEAATRGGEAGSRSVGVVESPTGTGKTLALLCGAVHWLEDVRESDRAREAAARDAEREKADLPSWLVESERDFYDSKRRAEEEEDEDEMTPNKDQRARKRKFGTADRRTHDGASAAEGTSLMRRIIYASRTHSQLAQVVHEFRRMEQKYRESTSALGHHGEERAPPARLSSVQLGSRANLCINEKVLRMQSNARINEMCMDMQSVKIDDLSDDVSEIGYNDIVEQRREERVAGGGVGRSGNENELDGISTAVRLRKRQSTVTTAAHATAIHSAEVTRPPLAPNREDGTGNSAMLSRGESGEKAEPARDHSRRRPRNSSKGGCPFLKSSERRDALRSSIRSDIMDIEDLTAAGKREHSCPYYAARAVAESADVIFVPYAALIQRETRESMGIRLDGALVIIDEAHNITEAVENVHSSSVDIYQLQTSLVQLETYLSRYCMRLSPANRLKTQTLQTLGSSFVRLLSESTSATGTESGVWRRGLSGENCWTVNDFLFSMNLDNINLFQLINWVHETKLAFKVSGCGAVGDPNGDASTPSRDSDSDSVRETSSFFAFMSFLTSLTNPDEDGRVIAKRKGGGTGQREQLKYLLLDASAHFESVVEEAHCVVLAGGTLQPVSTLRRHLMPSLEASQVVHFSGDHVITRDRMLALPMRTGPTGKHLELTYSRREDPGTVDEIGRALVNICRIVPNGVIVFFPSYSYADLCFERWSHQGGTRLIESMSERKSVFREPRGTSNLDDVLSQYSVAATTGGGAVLFGVVGGKMSEGINFADELGRCVVVVGLPYANKMDPELLEKIRHLDGRESVAGAWGKVGREYYEESCMKAVNQSIGRAIRHKADYASVVLMDSRYGRGEGVGGGPMNRLPKWIQDSVPQSQKGDGLSFGECFARLREFFVRHREESVA